MTYQSGDSDFVRQGFLDYGELADFQDIKYRAINDNYPVFGFGAQEITQTSNSD